MNDEPTAERRCIVLILKDAHLNSVRVINFDHNQITSHAFAHSFTFNFLTDTLNGNYSLISVHRDISYQWSTQNTHALVLDFSRHCPKSA